MTQILSSFSLSLQTGHDYYARCLGMSADVPCLNGVVPTLALIFGENNRGDSASYSYIRRHFCCNYYRRHANWKHRSALLGLEAYLCFMVKSCK
jgi:hypothetical protein